MLSLPGGRTGGTGMLSLPSARVSVVLSLRGGVGTTTVAVNLAGLFARAGRRACLVDLSPSGGHVALQLRLRPTATWADLGVETIIVGAGAVPFHVGSPDDVELLAHALGATEPTAVAK